MEPLVLKFGGTSVADAERLRAVADIVEAAAPRAPVVVLSATAGTTNDLLVAADVAAGGDAGGAHARTAALWTRHRSVAGALLASPDTAIAAIDEMAAACDSLLQGVALLRELSDRSRDAIVSFGERLSTTLLVAHLRERGLSAEPVDARVLVKTDDVFGKARPDEEATRAAVDDHLRPLCGAGRIVVTEGFLGSNAQGVTTTLGRGGSDYSAALLGRALGAAEVQIWTDVEGVFTADPRIVPDARPIEVLSFGEAGELAAFGAKVLHPATIQPAVRAGIPVTVRDSRRPGGRFTTIRAEVTTGRSVTAIASRAPVTVITVTSTHMLHQAGFLARLFEVFGRHGIDVDLVATAEVSVSLTVAADAALEKALRDLSAFATLSVSEDRAIVAVIGERLKATAGLATRIFSALADINVEMISMGANEINLSLVVERARVDDAVRRLHHALLAPTPAVSAS